MERSIRIGKDFNVRWSIKKVVDGERQPYVLAGKELVLQYRTPYGELKEAKEWKVVGNTIVWTFRGKEQKALGSYELILTENGGKDGMVTVDTRRAFKLVAHSCEETEGSGCDIVIEDVVLESEVAFAPVVTHDDTAIWEALASQEQLIEDLQNMKIDREADDYYPKLSVGLADNLAGVDVVDSEINFRRSGGGAITDGVARIETIKGNSVVWNQLWDVDGDNRTDDVKSMTIVDGKEVVLTITSNGAFSRIRTQYAKGVAGHRYFVTYAARYNSKSENSSLKSYVGFSLSYANQMELTGSYAIYSGIWVGDYAGPMNVGIIGTRNEGDVVAFKDIQVIDLTQMFGSGNEPTTIEEFYQRAPLGVDLNAYNEGEVIHMDVQSIESVGVNQWDEEWELGRINPDTGTLIVNTKDIRCKNFIEVFPDTDYYFVGGAQYYVVYYDKDYQHVDWWNVTGTCLLHIPANVHYVKLSRLETTTYAHDICINISDTSINGKYYPYIKRVEDLAVIRKYFPDGMKSAGTIHDEIRYNKASGKWEMVQRIGSVDMGTLKWSLYQGNFYSSFGAASDIKINSILLCSAYNGISPKGLDYSGEDKAIWSQTNASDKTIAVRDTTYTDVETFKAMLQEKQLKLYYELAEPIVTELDEADQFKDLDYAVWNAGTEKAIAEGKSAPLAADITYGFNAIGKIKELESLVAALRAKVGI